MSNLLDKYLFQALDAYPYYLEEAVESLNYALSYDQKNPTALSLLGLIHAECLKDYPVAKEYYQQALAEDMYAIAVYPRYIDVLLWNEDYIEAEKLIKFALTIKGTDKGLIYLKKAILFEQQKKYSKALKNLKLAKENTYNNLFMDDLNEEKSRIKGKMPKTKKSKSKSSKKESKK